MDWNVIEQQLIINAKKYDEGLLHGQAVYPLNTTEFWTREFLKRHSEIQWFISDVMVKSTDTIRDFETWACWLPLIPRIDVKEWARLPNGQALAEKIDKICLERQRELIRDLSLSLMLSREYGRVYHWMPYLIMVPVPTICPETFEPMISFKHSRGQHSIDPKQYPDYDHTKYKTACEGEILPFL